MPKFFVLANNCVLRVLSFQMDYRGRVLAFIGAVAFVVVAVLVWRPSTLLPALGDMEWFFYDWHLEATARTKPLTLEESPVVIIAMTDETPIKLAVAQILEDPFYPLPRFCHADLLAHLKRSGARAVAFDIFFTEASDHDASFAAALKAYPGTIAATRPEVNEQGQSTFVPLTGSLFGLVPASVEVLRSTGRSVRFIRPLVQDGVALDMHVPHLGVALGAAGNGALTQAAQLTGGHLRWGGLTLPLATSLGDSAALVRYLGPEGTFPILDYEEVLLSEKPSVLLKDKLVLVGRQSTLEDRHMTPLGEMTGVEILANIVTMATRNRGIRTAEAWSLWIGLLLTVVFLWLVWRFTLAPALIAPLVLGTGWVFLVHAAFLRTGVWWESATPLTMLGLAAGLATPYEILRAHRAFKTQVSASAARSAVTGRGMQLGTREVYVTVVFCDIRGFTSFCETHSADEVEKMLQSYFEAGNGAAKRFGSELDKFMGDAILLYFFEFPRLEPGAVRAVRWAWEMQRVGEQMGIQMGIGIASGVAREGFIGTAGRMQRTVIGDIVNLASRLQDATKTLETPILLSEGSFLQLTEAIAAEPLGEITVRGKQIPVQVFRPVRTQEL